MVMVMVVMTYLKLTETDIGNLSGLGIKELLVELILDGSVVREVGIDNAGIVIHKFPGKGKFSKYGLLDGQIFDMNHVVENMNRQCFEQLFNQYT